MLGESWLQPIINIIKNNIWRVREWNKKELDVKSF